MEVHLQSLRDEVNKKQFLLNEREAERQDKWSTWNDRERELHSLVLQETREELFELKRQVNSTLVAYNEVASVERALPFGQRHFSIEKIEHFQKKLAVPLSRDDVSSRQAGGRQEVVYLETHKAIEKAREIFGLSDLSIEIRGEPSVLFQGNVNGKTSVCMKAIVRVTLANGCFHEDVGVSSSCLGDPTDAVKMASKACVSDGIKRALQHFGPALGSCLRDKEFVSQDLMVANKQPPTQNAFNQGQNKRPKQIVDTKPPLPPPAQPFQQQQQQQPVAHFTTTPLPPQSLQQPNISPEPPFNTIVSQDLLAGSGGVLDEDDAKAWEMAVMMTEQQHQSSSS
jgi:DNA recombination protein Rad52